MNLRGTGITVRFGDRVALDSVSFELPTGSSTALVGANGSGKTTLLNVLAGLVTPSSGTLEPRRPRVAYVLQHARDPLWVPVTVEEVLRMSRYRRRPFAARLKADDRAAIQQAADRLDISHLGRVPFGELSGGQRQRVLVAQALAQEADVVLMDEPITGLDMPSQERILAVIDDETAAGRTVVITTHHLEEAHHCQQVLVLANRLVAAGTPEEALRPDVLREAYDDHMFGAHADHDHPVGVLWLDDHGHGHDSTD